MKSQILAKATAELTQDVMDKDLKTSDKNIGEILDGQYANKCGRDGVYGSSSKDNGKNKKEV
jgi:hypothetical protein